MLFELFLMYSNFHYTDLPCYGVNKISFVCKYINCCRKSLCGRGPTHNPKLIMNSVISSVNTDSMKNGQHTRDITHRFLKSCFEAQNI